MIHFKSIICSSLLDKRLEEIFSTDLYQKMSDIYRTKLTLPLFQICWISFDPKLVNIIKLQLISSFSPQTWKQSFSLNLLNLISIALSYTKTDQSRCWAWHCSAPACFYHFWVASPKGPPLRRYHNPPPYVRRYCYFHC